MAKRIKSAPGLLQAVDQYLTTSEVGDLDTRAKHFYPTSASCRDTKGELHGACLRAVAYDHYSTGKSNPYSPETMYTFELGRQIESMYIEIFKRMGLFVADHIKFYNPDFHVSGELDVVLREAPGSPIIYGLEVKTSYGDYFKMAQITGRPGVPAAPKEEHVMQVMMYLDNFPKLPYFKLIYLGRDKFDRTEYTIRLVEVNGDKLAEITHLDGHTVVDPGLSIARIYNRYKDLRAYINKKELPPRDYRPTMTLEEMQADLAAGKLTKTKMKSFEKGEIKTADWRCRYCNHKSLCRVMPEEKVENFMDRFKVGEWVEED
jgi:hypothetical protein